MSKPYINRGHKMNFKAHCFPLIQSASLHENGDEESTSCFQPLYNCGSGRAQRFTKTIETRDSRENAIGDPEEVRQQGFQRGYDAGQSEAHRLSISSITPAFQDFLDFFGETAQFSSQVASASAQYIIALALVIAEKVLNAPITLTAEDLAEIHADLHSTVGKAYQLILCFHPDDLKALQELSRTADITWPDYPAIVFQDNLDVPKGSLKAPPLDRHRSSLEKQLTKNLEAFRYPSM